MHDLAQDRRPVAAGRDELVRVVVVGSVDDGKSTLIGRLLYECGALHEDHVAHVRRVTRSGAGTDGLDFSLFTDGLKAEREQAITIDVAYRYFSTARRRFILADTPGHAEYTRNMATGASTADVALLLLDARHGLRDQTRRHACIAALLGIRHVAVAVNKMDLAGWDRAAFERIRDELTRFSAPLGFHELRFVPLSAATGDNVTTPSRHTPWHEGTLLAYLESVPAGASRADGPLRLPVQGVVRPHQDYRGVSGQIASGVLRPGDEVVVLPSGRRTRVRAIDAYEGELDIAFAPMSVTVRLEDEIDVGRGDLLAGVAEPPAVCRRLSANLVWLSAQPLDPGRPYLVKHTTRLVPAHVEAIEGRVDLRTLAIVPAPGLGLNDIGRVRLSLTQPLVVDAYARQRAGGAFILIDALTNATVGAGMVERADAQSAGTAWRDATSAVDDDTRRRRLGHGAALVWSESAALAYEIEGRLFAEGCVSAVVSGNPDAALACARAGLVAIHVPAGSPPEWARQRAALRVSGAPLIDAGEGGGPAVLRALAERGVLGRAGE